MTHLSVEVSSGRAAHNQVRQNLYHLYLLERCRIAPYHTRRFEFRINPRQQQKLALTLSHSHSSNCTVQPRCSDCPRLSITPFAYLPHSTLFILVISRRRLRDSDSPLLNTDSLRTIVTRRNNRRPVDAYVIQNHAEYAKWKQNKRTDHAGREV